MVSSRNEELMTALINGEDVKDYIPRSRNEQFLKDCAVGSETITLEPRSRSEMLLSEVHNKIKSGSGFDVDLKSIFDKTKSAYCFFIGIINGNYKTFCYYYIKDLNNLIKYEDTSNVNNMDSMFSGCANLITAPNMDTSNVTDMSSIYFGCSNLTIVPQYNTSNVTNMGSMFESCENLTTVHQLDIDKVTFINWIVNGCSKLEYIKLLNVRINIQIGSGNSWGHLIQKDCLIQIISELIKPESGTRTLTMGSTNTAKLADTYVKLLEDDGTGKYPFELCESTAEGAMTITDYCLYKNWQLA